jgi:hypothetical protein
LAEREGVFEFVFRLFTARTRGSLSSSASTASRESQFSTAFADQLSFSDFSGAMALAMALVPAASERSNLQKLLSKLMSCNPVGKTAPPI